MLTRISDGDSMIHIIKEYKNYYSQRNNKYDQMNTCNVTSMIQAADLRGYKFPEVEDENGNKIAQPEDRLYYICNNNIVIKEYYKAYCKKNGLDWYDNWIANPDSKTVYRPNEVHAVLCYATNFYLSFENSNYTKRQQENRDPNIFVEFNDDTPIGLIATDLMGGFPVVMSGCFNGLNHVVTAVGLVTDSYGISDIIINDPYGETYNYKNNPNGGCGVHIPYEKFISDFKQLNNTKSKFAHRFC